MFAVRGAKGRSAVAICSPLLSDVFRLPRFSGRAVCWPELGPRPVPRPVAAATAPINGWFLVGTACRNLFSSYYSDALRVSS